MTGTGGPSDPTKIDKMRIQIGPHEAEPPPQEPQKNPDRPDQYSRSADYSKLKTHPETSSVIQRLKNYLVSGGDDSEKHKAYRVKEGKLQPIDKGAEREAAKSQESPLNEKNLSLFEKVFLSRFRDGKMFGDVLNHGQSRFREKSQGEWGGFFERLKDFAFKKKVPIGEVERMIHRGLFQNNMVSDVAFRSGQMDKFARIPITKGEILAQLAKMPPGEAVGKEQITQWLSGLELAYLSLSYRPIQLSPEATSRAEAASRASAQASELLKRGKFDFSKRAEQDAVRELSLEGKYGLPDEVKKKSGIKSKIAAIGRRGTDEEWDKLNDEPGYIPWYVWLLGRKREDQKKTNFRLWLFYFLATAFIVATVISIVRLFL